MTIKMKSESRNPKTNSRDISIRLHPSILALAIAQALTMPEVQAATIQVDETCTLTQALISANDVSTSIGLCEAGTSGQDGVDTIVLPENSIQTFSRAFLNPPPFGIVKDANTATPNITTPVIIEGNGSIIQRDSGAPSFRLFHVNRGNLTLNNVTIRNGNTVAGGGGIFVRGDLTLNKSTISDNTFNNSIDLNGGGGIYVAEESNVSINNSTISGNTSSTDGGGIFVNSFGFNDSDVSISNSTISNNSANASSGNGGGIFAGLSTRNISFTNSIVAGNHAAQADEIYSYSSSYLTSIGGNLFGDNRNNDSGAFTNFSPAVADINGTTTDANHLLTDIILPFSDNGLNMFTHSLPINSPAVDSGLSCDALDQRGFARNSGECDIGAIELLSTPADMIVNTTEDQGEGCTLREAIRSINLGTSVGDCATTDLPQNLVIDESLAGSTINLTSALPQITSDLTITGDALSGLTLNANSFGSVLDIASSATVSLSHLTLTGGSSTKGGGILASGNINLNNCTISGNTVSDSGGGIYSNGGSLSLTQSTVSGNSAHQIGGGVYANGGSLTFTQSTVSGNSARQSGGGVYANGGSLTLTQSTITENIGEGIGGGIHANSGTVIVTDSTISENQANIKGGGVYVSSTTLSILDSRVDENQSYIGSGIYASSSNLSFNNSSLLKNTGGFGVGIYTSAGTTSLTNSTVSGNSASGIGGVVRSRSAVVSIVSSRIFQNSGMGIMQRSGGLDITNSAVYGNSDSGVFATSAIVNLTNSTVSGNSSTTLGGGMLLYRSSVSLTNSSIHENIVTGTGSFPYGLFPFPSRGGAGIYSAGGSLSVSESTISGNTATGSGGGILVTRADGGGSITLTNSTVSGNTATADGGGIGGITTAYRGGHIDLINTTVSDNFAGVFGGGVFVEAGSSMSLSNSIIANSINSAECVNEGSLTASGTNIIEDNSCSSLVVLRGDPKLGPLTDNGGPTLTHALQLGSQALDTGDNDICAGPLINNLDQRGETRPVGDACDVGAFEFNPDENLDENLDENPDENTNFYVIPLPNGKTVIFSL